MADTDDTGTNDNDDANNSGAGAGGGTDDQELGAGGKKALDAERDARKTAEKELREAKKSIADLASKIKGFEDRDKSDAEKLADRIAELEKSITEKDTVIAAKDRDAERAKVAAEKGVPLSLVTGATREEMEAAADAALEWRGTNGRKGLERKSGLQDGAAGAPDGSSKQEQAAAAVRALRAGR